MLRRLGVTAVPLQLGRGTGDAGQQTQMTAGRIAGDADAVGVDVVFVGVGAEPTDGAFDVFNLCGKRISRLSRRIGIGKTVGHRDGDVTATSRVFDVGLFELSVAADPAAAVNDKRCPGPGRSFAQDGPGSI